MDIVNSQILQENISRILSIIGLKPSPINESAPIITFLLKKSDDLINFFTRDGAKKDIKDLGFIAQDLKKIDDDFYKLSE